MNNKNLTMMLNEQQRRDFEETITVEAHPLDNYAMLQLASKRYPNMTVVDFVDGLRQDKLSIVLVGNTYFDKEEILMQAKRVALVGKQIN